MKILWLVNIVMPELAVHLGREPSVFGGWLNGAMQAIRQSDNELVVCTTEESSSAEGSYEVSGVKYYITSRKDKAYMMASFSEILVKEKPDVVHIYGTEFMHSFVMGELVESNRLLVTIQGYLKYIKEEVFAGISDNICRDNIYHSLLRKLGKGGISIELQKNSFEERFVYEEVLLKKAGYINGGSKWGNEIAKKVNPDATVLDCNLILRQSFYEAKRWRYEDCEKHTIYALYTYPIKGFHKLLEAVAIVKEHYPDVKVITIGNKQYYRSYNKLKTMLMNKAPDYQWYVQGLIEKYNLKDNLEFAGYLDEQQVQHYLRRANVFVSSSSIENQSTALGEAMMLGVPCIASCVGAIPEMIDDGVDGFLYPFSDTRLLADNICKIFENERLAKQFSIKGQEHSLRTYDRDVNTANLIEMYNTIYDNNREDN